MAGIRGKSGPPGNQNAFRHGLAGLRSAELMVFSIPQNNQSEGAAAQISTAMRVLVKIIASDVCRCWSHSIMRLTACSRTTRRQEQIPKHWHNWTARRGRW
jgi:hypothetical protein